MREGDLSQISMYAGLEKKLGSAGIPTEIIENTKRIAVCKMQSILHLISTDDKMYTFRPSKKTFEEVRDEVDYVLSLGFINRLAWKSSANFTFHGENTSTLPGAISIDYKTDNLGKSIWRAIKMYKNPGLNLGEKFMRGEYDVMTPGLEPHEALELFISKNYKYRKALDKQRFYKPLDWFLFGRRKERENTVDAASENISEHYDFGNEFYQKLLSQGGDMEEFMQYSCGVDGSIYGEVEGLELKKENTLEAFQWNKMKLHCEKMGLKPGMRVLDVGCGWGSLAKFMHEEYQVEVVGVTLSKEQFDLATERNNDLEGVTIIQSDVRNLPTGIKFDRIVSVGAFEHFRDFYEEFFKKSASYLEEGGIMSLHTIGTTKKGEVAEFFSKYIFPGGYLPSIGEVTNAYLPYFKGKADYKFPTFENLGEHYARTLEFWIQNLVKMKEEVITEYGEEKYRMFLFYLVSSKVSFRDGYMTLNQYILEKR